MAGVGLIRLRKELKMLADEPPPGVCCWPAGSGDCLTHLEAQIQGPEDTPYERGTFLLDIQIPDRYPFEPPKVRFVTPIYHPNIDSGGRICLDSLKMRPAGSWTPSMNVPTLLTTIRLLMAHPNGEDGLMPDITELFLKNPSRFADIARAHVEKHARQELARGAEAATTAAPEGRPKAKDGHLTRSGNTVTATSRSEGIERPLLADAEDLPQTRDTATAAAAGADGEGEPNERRERGQGEGKSVGDAEGAKEGHDAVVGGDGSVMTEISSSTGGGSSGVEAEDREREIACGSAVVDGKGEAGGGGEHGREGGGEAEDEEENSDDGAWSDSDDDDDDDDDSGGGGSGGVTAKRARMT